MLARPARPLRHLIIMRLHTAILGLLAAVSLASGKVSYQGYKFMKVELNTQQDADRLQMLEADASVNLASKGFRVGVDTFVYLAPGEEGVQVRALLDEQNLKYNILDYDVQELFDRETEAIKNRQQEWEILKQADTRAVDFDIYNFHTHDEINQYLYDLEGL